MRLSRHTKIGIGWVIVTIFGVGGFIVAKEWAMNNRREAMNARIRVREALEKEIDIKRREQLSQASSSSTASNPSNPSTSKTS